MILIKHVNNHQLTPKIITTCGRHPFVHLFDVDKTFYGERIFVMSTGLWHVLANLWGLIPCITSFFMQSH